VLLGSAPWGVMGKAGVVLSQQVACDLTRSRAFASGDQDAQASCRTG
jgi:hypothetical protein